MRYLFDKQIFNVMPLLSSKREPKLNLTDAEVSRVLLPWQIEAIKSQLVSKLFEQELLRESSFPGKYYFIAIDATGTCKFDHQTCKHYLTKTSKNGFTPGFITNIAVGNFKAFHREVELPLGIQKKRAEYMAGTTTRTKLKYKYLNNIEHEGYNYSRVLHEEIKTSISGKSRKIQWFVFITNMKQASRTRGKIKGTSCNTRSIEYPALSREININFFRLPT